MLVLDTLNVLHTVGVLPPELAGLDVPGLAGLIIRSRFATERVVFVCDGLPATDLPAPGPLHLPDAPGAAMEMRYSGKGITADDLIRRIIEASTAPRRLTIVSSDHAIQRDARKRRCNTLSSEEFLQHLADDADLPRGPSVPPRHRPPMMSDAQVRKWIDVFGIDEDHATNDAKAQDVTSPRPVKPTRAMDPKSLAPVDMPKPILPENVLHEAEEMLRREAGPRSATPTSDAPKLAPPATPPPPSPAESVVDSEDEIDLESIDMDAILGIDDTGQPRREPKRGSS